MSDTLPMVVTAAGLTPIPPQTLWNMVIALALTYSPGLTGNLPAGLINDVAGTDTATLVLANQAMIELMNSLTPYGCNLFTLQQQGQIYLGPGSAPAPASNTGVYVVFTTSPSAPGFIIPTGFLVSDGTNQYAIQAPGGAIGSVGSSQPLSALAVVPGSWAVPIGTVTQLASSVSPSTVGLTVTNPLAGTPGGAQQTASQYRTQVLQAGLAAAQGMPNMMKTALQAVPGVIPGQISVRQPATGEWEIIVGGAGDPYLIGAAIYNSLFDISTLVGSTLGVTAITLANPGVVTTNLNHNYTTGQAVVIAGVDPTNYNGSYTATVLSPTTFSIGTSTTGFPAYVSGGVVTPNFRNTSVAIYNYPDTYTIPYVIPPAQTVTMTVTWNTSSTNYVSSNTIAQAVQAAIAAYINGLPIGAPINVGVLATTFYAAVAAILPQTLVTTLTFSITILGVVTAPEAGTQIVVGDPESTFLISASSVIVTQG